MKILHLSAVKSWGGGENHIENLCRELRVSNPEIENFILCAKGKKFHKRLKDSNLNFATAPLSLNFDPRYISKIIRLSKVHNFDLIHLHDPRAMALAITADHFYNLPPFIFSKKTSFPIRKKKRTLFKYNYSKIKRILCVSEASRNVSIERLGDDKRLKVIYHGTRLDNKSQKCPFSLRNRLKLSSEKILIGNIANHIEAKNLETFIRTADYLVNRKKLEQFHFVQIGSFSTRTENLQKLTTELNLENHISFLDYLPEASNFIPQFDVTLITSENEGIPQVIYESFYHKIPVVSTDVGGISEVIEHNVNGLLCKPYDHIALGENILFLMDNPQVIPTFAEISRKKLLEHFTSTRMAKETLEEYKKVVDGQQH